MAGDINLFNLNRGSGENTRYKPDAGNTVIKAAKVAMKLGSGNGTIARMAKDTILQYPIIMSSDVAPEDAVVLARAFERQFASLFMLCWGANDNRLNDGEKLADKIARDYHNNNSIPSLIRYGSDLINGRNSAVNDIATIADKANSAAESVSIVSAISKDGSFYSYPKETVMECWTTIEEQVVTESLNDIYLPNKAVIDKIESVLESKGRGKGPKNQPTPAPTSSKGSGEGPNNQPTPAPTPSKGSGGGPKNRPAYHKFNKNNGLLNNMNRFTNKIDDQKSRYAGNAKYAGLPKDTKLNALEPLLLEVEYVYNAKEGAPIIRKGLIGIKSMIRRVSSDIMVSNIIGSLESSRFTFKFIKWTKGEYKVRDILFGVSGAKKDALDRRSGSRWFKALKKRKTSGKLIRGTNLSPITTIVISSLEVEKIKENLNIDLTNPDEAKKLLTSLYLLGFVIYDAETKIVSAIFDGDDGYSDVSINGLKADNKKETDFANLKDMAKLFGKF